MNFHELKLFMKLFFKCSFLKWREIECLLLISRIVRWKAFESKMPFHPFRKSQKKLFRRFAEIHIKMKRKTLMRFSTFFLRLWLQSHSRNREGYVQYQEIETSWRQTGKLLHFRFLILFYFVFLSFKHRIVVKEFTFPWNTFYPLLISFSKL